MAWSISDIPDLSGKVAVVTGANSGLGLETTRELARRGALVVMGTRDQERASEAVRRIEADVPGARLDNRVLDLASLESVRAFASDVEGDHPVIDLLVNNAGLMAVPHARTKDGFEMQFGVNHLGHFALTALLASSISRSPAGRIVTVTSTGRFLGGPVDPSNPHLDGNYGPWRAYGQSKLANLHFAVELAERLELAGSPISSLAADPGFSATDLQAHSARSGGGAWSRFFHVGVRLFGASPSRGAAPQLRASTDPGVGNGELYAPRWIAHGSPVRVPLGRRGRNPAARRTLWEVSEKETGILFDVTDTTFGRGE